MINEAYYRRIRDRFDSLAKPLDSLGDYEEVLSRMGAILKDETIDISRAALLILISDNGIIEEGVSQSSYDVTRNVALSMGRRRSSACLMAREAGVDVFPFNVGMKEADSLEEGVEEIPGVDNRYYIHGGSRSFLREPALSEEEVNLAISYGRAIVRECKKQAYQALLLGEMGIGNTTTSTAVICSLLQRRPEDICGRGAGLSDAGLKRKIEVIDEAIHKYGLYEASPEEVLRTVGGYDIAVMTGIILAAIEEEIPVILDGLITASAALLASRMDERAAGIFFFSHKGREEGISCVADSLDQKILLGGNLALGEGSGAVMYYASLKCALAVYQGNTTFDEMGIEKYRRQI